MKKTKLSNLTRLTCGALLSMFLLNGCSEEDIVQPSQEAFSLSETGYAQTLPEACTSVCLVAGQNDNVGSVDIAVADDGDLLVTYRVTKASVYLSEIHLDIFSSLEQFKKDKKLSNGGAIPGKFAFKKSWGSKSKVSTYTVEIPKNVVQGLEKNCISIASHAALTNGETAWGGACEPSPKGVSVFSAKQFPGKNWGVYFDFCLDKCSSPIDFTYAWEDMKYGDDQDGDYNDLVVQANVVRSVNSLDLSFLVTARGADYDHQFKIIVPKNGIAGGKDGIVGAEDITETEDGDSFIITVINSTKSALPGRFANTVQNLDCVPYALAKIQLKTDASFSYNPDKPYIPFISVYQNGSPNNPNDKPHYDLSIYELTGEDDDTYTLGGEKYPNGIIIPRDWKWPLEHTFVAEAYPNFTSLTKKWNPNWAENLVDASKTYDATKCNKSIISSLK